MGRGDAIAMFLAGFAQASAQSLRHCEANMDTAAHGDTLVWEIGFTCFPCVLLLSWHRGKWPCSIGDVWVGRVRLCRVRWRSRLSTWMYGRCGMQLSLRISMFFSEIYLARQLCCCDDGCVATFAPQWLATPRGSRIVLRHPTEHSPGVIRQLQHLE